MGEINGWGFILSVWTLDHAGGIGPMIQEHEVTAN